MEELLSLIHKPVAGFDSEHQSCSMAGSELSPCVLSPSASIFFLTCKPPAFHLSFAFLQRTSAQAHTPNALFWVSWALLSCQKYSQL